MELTYGNLRLLPNDTKIFLAYNAVKKLRGMVPDAPYNYMMTEVEESIATWKSVRKTRIDRYSKFSRRGTNFTTPRARAIAMGRHLMTLIYKVHHGETPSRVIESLMAVLHCARYAGISTEVHSAQYAQSPEYDRRMREQTEIYKDLFNNEYVERIYHHITPDIINMAKMVATENETALILADALEEHGEGNQLILEHLRSSKKHYPGCWAVRQILGLPPYK